MTPQGGSPSPLRKHACALHIMPIKSGFEAPSPGLAHTARLRGAETFGRPLVGAAARRPDATHPHGCAVQRQESSFTRAPPAPLATSFTGVTGRPSCLYADTRGARCRTPDADSGRHTYSRHPGRSALWRLRIQPRWFAPRCTVSGMRLSRTVHIKSSTLSRLAQKLDELRPQGRGARTPCPQHACRSTRHRADCIVSDHEQARSIRRQFVRGRRSNHLRLCPRRLDCWLVAHHASRAEPAPAAPARSVFAARHQSFGRCTRGPDSRLDRASGDQPVRTKCACDGHKLVPRHRARRHDCPCRRDARMVARRLCATVFTQVATSFPQLLGCWRAGHAALGSGPWVRGTHLLDRPCRTCPRTVQGSEPRGSCD